MASGKAPMIARLENAAVCLVWEDGKLVAANRLSGRAREFGFPAFAIRLGAETFTANRFVLIDAKTTREEARFAYRLDKPAIRVVVTYSLEGEKPWFRKQLLIEAPPGLPTPSRLWVDLQENPPRPIRRVGYGLRGGPDVEEVAGLDTYASQPGCGYPVYAGDWFMGVEHPSGFAVPGDRLELFHHPTWDENGRIDSFSAVYGAARDHERVASAFMDYLWHIRLPRLSCPLVTVTSGWSTRHVGGGEYVGSMEGNEAFLKALLELGLRPDALALDAGYFDRRSLFRHKGDDDQDSRFIAFAGQCKEHGPGLSLWVSHNGRTGFDMDWIRSQGWHTGKGPGTPYCHGEFVVMMQPGFEQALGERFQRLVGEIGASHLKIDWDNECATSGEYAERYPTPNHVREASIKAFNRIDERMRATNPDLVTRNGWWPSPWWLCRANHVWLVDSGDCEYASWPSRTQRDREITHRDAMYHQILVRSETPCPLDAFDNHGFAHALENCFSDAPHTWLDNAVLAFTRGTTYLHMPLCPEGLRQWQADALRQVLDWMHHHADELGTRDACMVGGNPALGAAYGYLHPREHDAWLVLRNPSPEPQGVVLPLASWLPFTPKTVRQVYPFWQDLSLLEELTLLGHEVRLFRVARDSAPCVSPIPGSPFMVRACGGRWEYLFPGNKPLTSDVGPTVHHDMQIAELTAQRTADEKTEGGWRLQWYAGVPHRFERAELQVKLRGAEDVLDATSIRAGCCRYRGGGARHTFPAERIFRNETRGHGTSRVLPPIGARERDDYVFTIPDGGWVSLTVDLTGPSAAALKVDAWITGYEAPARQAVIADRPPEGGPLLPVHPCGFSRFLRL